jgi:predicted nuclease of restriction endonuclease-like (RecB) superfamily
MNETPKKSSRATAVKRGSTTAPSTAEFDEVLRLIDDARARALTAVNIALMELYWALGEYISLRIEAEGWGEGTVKALAEHIAKRRRNVRGFSVQNLWRMRQFYETYGGHPKLSALLRELSWTHNLLIMGKCKRSDEREFYLRLAHDQQWQSRESERQINGALFERTVLSPTKLSAPLRELHPDAASIFRDSYLVEFVDLPPTHSEADLQRALVEQLKKFLIELGRDFCFVDSQYPIQVGGRDFALDLLFFNRALNALIAFELKVVEFEPEHLGKLQFYLEALDRDVKKPHEQPSIGVLLCATKNNEVVEYAMSRAMSPALVAEYQTRLPDKKLLRAKLKSFMPWPSRRSRRRPVTRLCRRLRANCPWPGRRNERPARRHDPRPTARSSSNSPCRSKPSSTRPQPGQSRSVTAIRARSISGGRGGRSRPGIWLPDRGRASARPAVFRAQALFELVDQRRAAVAVSHQDGPLASLRKTDQAARETGNFTFVVE